MRILNRRWVWLALLPFVGPALAAPPVEEESTLGKGPLNSAVFRRDGKQILTTMGSQVQLWDVATGKEVRRFEGHQGTVHIAIFSTDGQRVATGSGTGGDMGIPNTDTTARIWDAGSGKELRRFDNGPPVNGDLYGGIVFGVRFSPDGKGLLVMTGGASARLWDVDSGRLRFAVRASSGIVPWDNGLQLFGPGTFSPDGRTILTRVYRRVTIEDARSGKEVRAILGHALEIESEVFSPDGRLVLTASRDRTARTWDAQTGGQVRLFKGHEDAVTSAVFVAEGERVLTTSDDGTARLWDAETGQEIQRFTRPGRINYAMMSPDGRRILANWKIGEYADAKRFATLWDAADGREIQRWTLRPYYSSVSILSPDGKTILTGTEPTTLWGVPLSILGSLGATGFASARLPRPPTIPVRGVSCDAQGPAMAVPGRALAKPVAPAEMI